MSTNKEDFTLEELLRNPMFIIITIGMLFIIYKTFTDKPQENKKGNTIFILGEAGAGKSSLLYYVINK